MQSAKFMELSIETLEGLLKYLTTQEEAKLSSKLENLTSKRDNLEAIRNSLRTRLQRLEDSEPSREKREKMAEDFLIEINNTTEVIKHCDFLIVETVRNVKTLKKEVLQIEKDLLQIKNSLKLLFSNVLKD